MENKITLTIASLFNGEGFDKAGHAVKDMSKSVKDTTQAVGTLAGEMSGLNGAVGQVAGGIGKLMGALTGGGLTITIVAITTIVGLCSKWYDSIEETRKKYRQLMEEMEDGYTKKAAFAIDYARQKQEEFLNLIINKGKAAIDKLERMRDLARDMANARAGTSSAKDNLKAQRIQTSAERQKAGTNNQFTQRDIDLNARQQLNNQNKSRLEREKQVQDQKLDADEKLLKDKISEFERQKREFPQAQKDRRATIQKQIDEKNREMAVQQERINYYHDLNLNNEGDYEANRAEMKKAGGKRVQLSQERLKLQEEMARLERGDGDVLKKIDEKINKAKNDLGVIAEQRKTSELNFKTEQEKLEAERYKIETDRNKLAEDRKKKEAEDAKKAQEKADKEAKDRANANASNIEAEGQRKASSYQSKEAQNLVTTQSKIDALNAKRQGLKTPEEIAQWNKEMAQAQKAHEDAIKTAQQVVQEGKEQQSETKLQLTEELWQDTLSKRDYLQQKLDRGGWTKEEAEKLKSQITTLDAQANRLRNDAMKQAADITKNATPENKMDAIKNELQLLKDVAKDIRNESETIANNTRQNAADNLTGNQRKNNRNAADDQNKLNNKIKHRQDAQNKAADRDIENGGWFLDANGELKSSKGNNAPHLSKFQRNRLINRLKQKELENQGKAVQDRIQRLIQQQVNAANQVPPKLDEIRDLLKDNLKELNKAMKVN